MAKGGTEGIEMIAREYDKLAKECTSYTKRIKSYESAI